MMMSSLPDHKVRESRCHHLEVLLIHTLFTEAAAAAAMSAACMRMRTWSSISAMHRLKAMLSSSQFLERMTLANRCSARGASIIIVTCKHARRRCPRRSITMSLHSFQLLTHRWRNLSLAMIRRDHSSTPRGKEGEKVMKLCHLKGRRIFKAPPLKHQRERLSHPIGRARNSPFTIIIIRSPSCTHSSESRRGENKREERLEERNEKRIGEDRREKGREKEQNEKRKLTLSP